jgi:hypothetical protein
MSQQSFSRLNLAALRQSFMLGLNRSPLALPEEAAQVIRLSVPNAQPALAALALAGTRHRFARPAPAPAGVPETARLVHTDPRAILPPQARRHLLRVLLKADVETVRVTVGAALKRLAPLGLRLHPFDLPRVSAALRTCWVVPGMAERAYLALTQTDTEDEPQPSLLCETITAQNWRSFGKAARRYFLRELRTKDPAAGLAALEACFVQESAAVRSELVRVLHTGLSAADRPFLEGLEKDRAESVRSAAGELLSLIPGTEGYEGRLNRAAAAFKMKRGSKPQIVFTRPGGATGGYILHAGVLSLLENIPAEALAARLGMTVEAFLEALPDGDQAMLAALLRTAMAAGSAGTIAALTPRLSADALDQLMLFMPDAAGIQQTLLDRFEASTMPVGQQILINQFVTRLNKSGAYPRSGPLAALTLSIGGPLPPAAAECLLASASWREYLVTLATEHNRQKADPDSLTYTALLMPAASTRSFLSAIEPLPPAINRKAHEFAHFVLALPAPAQSPSGER